MLLLRPEAGDIAMVTGFAVVVGVLSLASPVAVEALVNTAAFGQLLQPIIVICLILLVFLSIAAAIRSLQTYIAEIIQRRIFVRVVGDLAYRLPRTQQAALDQHYGPELLNRFFDVMTVQKSAALLVLDGIAMALQTIISMILLWLYHPLLLGFDILMLVSLAFCILVLGRGAVGTAIRESQTKYAVAAWLERLAFHQIAFKSAAGPQLALLRADELTTDYLQARRRHFQILMRQIIFAFGVQALAGSLLLGLGAWLVINGKMNWGQLVAAELVMAVVIGSFAKLGKHMESFYDLLAAVEKLGHLFDLPTERNGGETLPEQTQPMQLELHDLQFAYRAGQTAVDHFSLRVPPGRIVALTGPAGGGKSTLLDLIFGLRAPSHGYVLMDKIDLRSLDLQSMRRQVTLLRENELAEGTVVDNLQVGKSPVTRAEIREVFAELDLLDELRQHPDGIETRLGPDGVPLTESQQRRLMVARHVLARPRLLLIDGWLDGMSDDALPGVFRLLSRQREHFTTIIATGRRDIADLCDEVVLIQPPAPPAARKPEIPNELDHRADLEWQATDWPT